MLRFSMHPRASLATNVRNQEDEVASPRHGVKSCTQATPKRPLWREGLHVYVLPREGGYLREGRARGCCTR
jgi:hypothetical protein